MPGHDPTRRAGLWCSGGCGSGIRASAKKQLPRARVDPGLASPVGWGQPSAALTLSWHQDLQPDFLPLKVLQNSIVLLLI